MTAEAPLALSAPGAGPSGVASRPRGRDARARGRSGLGRHRARAGILLSVPALVLVLFVLIVPIGEAIYYSMTNWNGLTSQWIGPSTYTSLFTDPVFWRVLENNGILLLAVPVALLVPLGIAALLHEHVWLWKLFRSLIFLPTAVSWVVIGMIAVRVFAPSGAVNFLLGLFGLGRLETDFLGHEYTAIFAVALTFVWSMIGTNTIIFLTGMSTVDPAIYEAAVLDGAGRWATFRRITVPMLKRYFQFTFVITMITAFTALFSLIFIMTGGGPGYGTTTLEFFVYQQAFDVGQFGTGAMLGVVLFVILFAVSLIQLKLLREDQ
ncbi:MAG: sugar ABC transporter permease [Actinomycetota bacterium]|nr:sugar ABC transporter permease [Actinomycetota bacterium]